MPSLLPFADASDIIRAWTKDDEYITLLETTIRDALMHLIPNATLSHPTMERLLPILSRTIYYLAPLWKPVPTTAGEEYAAILPVRMLSDGTVIPSLSVMTLLAIARGMGKLEIVGAIRHVGRMLRRQWDVTPGTIEALAKLHMACFYWKGVWRGVMERALRVRYVRVAYGDGVGGPALKWLAAFMALGVALRLCRSASRGTDEKQSAGDSGRGTCILCLSPMTHVAVTACGHVFCWDCICGWSVDNEACPLCRRPVALNKVVCLYNY